MISRNDVCMADALSLEAAARLKRYLHRTMPGRVHEVRIFGSRARGDAHAESDLDVALIVDDWEPSIIAAVGMAATLVHEELDLPYIVSPFIVSREHFDELLRTERRIARDIAEEGVPV